MYKYGFVIFCVLFVVSLSASAEVVSVHKSLEGHHIYCLGVNLKTLRDPICLKLLEEKFTGFHKLPSLPKIYLEHQTKMSVMLGHMTILAEIEHLLDRLKLAPHNIETRSIVGDALCILRSDVLDQLDFDELDDEDREKLERITFYAVREELTTQYKQLKRLRDVAENQKNHSFV